LTVEQAEQICVQACLSNNDNVYSVPNIFFNKCSSVVRRQRLVKWTKHVSVGFIVYCGVRYQLPTFSSKCCFDAMVASSLTVVNWSVFSGMESKRVRYLGCAILSLAGAGFIVELARTLLLEKV